jgi:EmrB/QacA subfamily drug resistance transporter
MSLHTPVTERPTSPRYPWIAMGVVLTGTFMVILDTTIVNVALPDVGRDLGAPGGVEWVVTAYLLAVGVSQLTTGWVSDRFGKKDTFTASLALFALGSLLSAFAPNLVVLVIFRILQGLGGGAMMPVGLAMIYELFPPHRRGTALGIWGIAAMAAPALGPVLGGWFATSVSWRWIFAVNVPIGALGLVLARRLLRDVGFRERRRLDVSSLVLAAVALSLLLVAFDRASAWGWGSLSFASLAGTGLAGLVWFVLRELRSESPLLEIRMFTVSAFSVTMAIVWLMTLAQFARLVIIPVELQVVHELTPLAAGTVLAPAALGTAVTMPLGGRIADHIGARVPVLVGLVVAAGAVWQLAHLSPSTSRTTITLILMAQGSGFGLAIMPNTVAAMNSLPARFTNRAAALRSLNRQVAGSLGVAVLASVVVAQIGTLTGDSSVTAGSAQLAYNDAFLVAFAGMVLAILLAFWLPGRDETRRLQSERQTEHASLDLT